MLKKSLATGSRTKGIVLFRFYSNLLKNKLQETVQAMNEGTG